ncbi:sulfite exporter TauE/SafE family protein [Magnetovibrio sp. PR-2]|uniref:sulfite exporter TauE/SafE family protein n=1 Tax=Magnetovibrio sp. PR-2 TaxID=3120356 RepID=UPI002FCE16A1
MTEDVFLQSLLLAGISHCSEAIDGSEGLLMALFMAGFAGGASHCIGMCGPFVLSQVQSRLEAVSLQNMSEFKRLSGGALFPYHFGRGTTYIVLGGLVGMASQQLVRLDSLKWLAAVLLAFAGVFFLGYALRSFGIQLIPVKDRNTAQEGVFARALGRWVKPLFAHPTGLRGYVLGLILGFIPCGLVYGALAATGAAGDWLTGVFAMMAFWLGTIPALFGLGLTGGALLGRWPDIAKQGAPVLLIVNGLFLMYLAWDVL